MLREVGCRLPAQSALARTATVPVPPIRCLVSAQSARLRAQQPTCQLGHVIGIQAQSARLRTRQPTCQLGHIIGAQAQSARLRTRQRWAAAVPTPRLQHNPRACAHGNRTSPTNLLLGVSEIRAYARTATYVPARPHHRRSSTIREFAHTATLGCGDSDTTAVAQSTRLHAGNRTGPTNPLLAISTIRAYARTAARAARR